MSGPGLHAWHIFALNLIQPILEPHLNSSKLSQMTPFTVQTLFLLYSAISLLSAILIGALFWRKKDFSANLWLWACLLTSVATAITIFRGDISPIISFSLMVSFETLSILLLGESLRQLGDNWHSPNIVDTFHNVI